MTILSDDLVEKAARAACQACGYEPDLHIENGVKRWQAYAIPARAALEAALPGIVEECAKVAEGHFPLSKKRLKSLALAHAAGNHIAAAIRNLKPKEEGNG